jgi:hypothetical protein
VWRIGVPNPAAEANHISVLHLPEATVAFWARESTGSTRREGRRSEFMFNNVNLVVTQRVLGVRWKNDVLSRQTKEGVPNFGHG